MKKFASYAASGLTLAMPMLAFAQSDVGIFGVLTDLDLLLNRIIGLLIVIASLVFVWGIIQYLIAGPDEDKAKTARTYMLYGIVSLAVIIAMWGLANLLIDTFGIQKDTIPGGIGE